MAKVYRKIGKRVRNFWHRLTSLVYRDLFRSMIFLLVVMWIVLSFWVYKIEHDVHGANITTFEDALWWGAVTVMTVGYGDRYPVTTYGRLVGLVVMLAGVVSIGVLMAKISSHFLERVLNERRGFMDSSYLKDHFIICGWKDEMHEILFHILDFNPGLTPNQIVIIAALPDSMIDEIKSHPRLAKVHVIAGDYFTEFHLKRAAPERARKIIILADRTPHTNGSAPPPTEVDARTIMTAMTLSHIAKGTIVVAEILDPKMDQFLKLASVSEILYSKEFGRLLLGNASGGTGVANIIFDLLDPRTSAFLTTVHIDEAFFGKTYAELQAEFDKHKNRVLLGILENSGNHSKIKELALRRAQKTTDMQLLLNNLQSVKKLKINSPIFNPDGDYVVTEGSMAIVIDQRNLEKINEVDGEKSRSVA